MKTLLSNAISTLVIWTVFLPTIHLKAQQAPPQSTAATTAWRSVIEAARPAVVVIRTDKGLGSGFLIKSDGTIVTNAHVIAGASAIEVKLAAGEIYRRVYVLTSDETEDIALLRIEAVRSRPSAGQFKRCESRRRCAARRCSFRT